MILSFVRQISKSYSDYAQYGEFQPDSLDLCISSLTEAGGSQRYCFHPHLVCGSGIPDSYTRAASMCRHLLRDRI